MALDWHLTLLGGFALRDGQGREHSLPSRRAWALVACVALAPRAARADLAERLWPGIDLAAGRRNRRRELARLREAGLQALLDTDGDDVALHAGVHCDAKAFRVACAHDDPEAALAAWGGAVLDGFVLAEAPRFDAWLQQQRVELSALWRHVVQRRIDQLEAAGQLREALHWNAQLHADEPLHEAHVQHAMQLHHRLGEDAAALALYARFTRALQAELGLAPSASTRALAERLQASARLAPQLAPARGLVGASLDAPLIGRERLLHAVAGSSAAMLLVTGEAGVGKTRLVQETLRASTTLSVVCDPAARGAALYPVAEGLQAALASPLRCERQAKLAPETRREVARLLPALASGPADVAAAAPSGAGAPSTADQARRERFFDALGELADALAGPGGTLWVDDLHAADEATLEWVGHLVLRHARDPRRHLRVVAAARGDELDAHPAALALVRRLDRVGLLQVLPVPPLDLAQTETLLHALAEADDPATPGPAPAAAGSLAERLQQATQGNVFHLLETLRHLLESGELRRGGDGGWSTRYAVAGSAVPALPLPPSLAATIVERVARLSSPARQLLEAAAHSRRGFTLAQLQPATALDEWQAVDGLDEALRLHLLRELRGDDDEAPPERQRSAAGMPRYEVAHALTRDALAATVRPERRRLIHDRLAQALIATREPAEHIAWHLDLAGRGADAVPWHRAAADEAVAVLSWREALGHLECAWAAADADTPGRAEIVRTRIDVARRLFDLGAMARAIDDLAALAAAQGPEVLALEACVLRTELGQLQKAPAATIPPLQAVLDRGDIARVATPSLHARAVAALANARLAMGRVDDARRVLDGLDAEDPRIEPDWRAVLLTARANAARLQNRPAEARPLLERVIAMLASPDQLDARLHAQNLLAHVQVMDGQPALALSTLQDVLQQAQRARLTMVLRAVLPNLATLCMHLGDLAAARGYLERAMLALQAIDNPATRAALSGRLAELRMATGDLGGALAAARQSMAGYEANGGGTTDYAPWVITAHVCLLSGVPRRAAREMSSLLQSPARSSGPGPRALVRLRRLAACVPQATPARARRLVALLLRVREAPDGAYLPAEADRWRAAALLRAGYQQAAWALARALPEAELGLFEAVPAVLALRLECVAAGVEPDAGLIDAAEAAARSALPLDQLMLLRALQGAHEAHGAAALARDCAERRAALATRLAATLPDQPELAQALLREAQVASPPT